MKTAQGYVIPWLASQADLLATDWVEILPQGTSNNNIDDSVDIVMGLV
jgi:hypothetical protein